MKLVVGPVLGQISVDVARILFEVNECGDIWLEISPLGLTKKKKKFLMTNVEPFRPHVFKLGDLESGVSYAYELKNKTESLAKSCFRIPKSNEPFKTLVVSCNALHMLKEGQLDLWASMTRDYGGSETEPAKVDILFHIGDQIYEYARDVWKRCYHYMLTLQEGDGKTTGEQLMAVDQRLGYAGEWTADPGPCDIEYVKDIMTELFRSLYRQNWSHPGTKTMLSRVSNQMILDDHDIRNGWGIIEVDRNEETIEYAVGQAAHRAYQEYQVQLWRDIDSQYHVDYRMLRRGNAGIFLMDVRNPRTFCYNPKAPYMGYEQMNYIVEILEDPTLESLMLVCSIPIILSSEQATEMAAKVDITCDVRDQWCQGSNKAEHCDLLSHLVEWKKKKPTRELLLVGGDIHMGLDSTITNGSEEFCKQVITSPITNEPTGGLFGWLQDAFIRDSFTLYKRFRVTHTNRLHKRNYASIDLTQDGWKYVLHDQ